MPRCTGVLPGVRSLAHTRPATTASLLSVAGGATLAGVVYQLFMLQAKYVRSVVPKPSRTPTLADGIYTPHASCAIPWNPREEYDCELMVFGDSLATGLGAHDPYCAAGSVIAAQLAQHTGQRIRLVTKAVMGATSIGLSSQVEAAQVMGCCPDIAIVLVGGNDVTAQKSITASVQRLSESLEGLESIGAAVVVGTCPNLSHVRVIPQPLRSFLGAWSSKLAQKQTEVIRSRGHRAVALTFDGHGDSIFSIDRFHPNTTGYKIVSELLFDEVVQVWEQLQDSPK